MPSMLLSDLKTSTVSLKLPLLKSSMSQTATSRKKWIEKPRESRSLKSNRMSSSKNAHKNKPLKRKSRKKLTNKD